MKSRCRWRSTFILGSRLEVQRRSSSLCKTREQEKDRLAFVSVKPQKREIDSGIYFVSSEECAANGTYISLLNHSTNADVDISRWVLKRRIDSATELRYTLPDGVHLQQGSTLTIFAASGASTVESSTKRSGVSSWSHQELVNKDLDSWGT